MANGIRRYKVYCHTNKINGKQYIGVTSQPLHRRFRNGEGKVHNTSRNMISKCCQGKSRSAGDYKGRPMMWRYIDGY